MDNQEFIKDFVEEALVHMENAEAGLLKLDQGQGVAEEINNIFRIVHSIKGTAGFFGLKNIVSLAHDLESFFSELRSGRMKLQPGMVDLLLEIKDGLKTLIVNVEDSNQMCIQKHLDDISTLMEPEKWQKQGVQVPADIQVPADKEMFGEISGSKKQLEEALKYGHQLYQVRITIIELEKRSLTPELYLGSMEAFGNVIEFNLANNQLTFFFTTVLEQELAALALGIPLDWITEMEINVDELDLNQLLVSGETMVQEEISKQSSCWAMPDVVSKVLSGEDSIRVSVPLLNNLLNLASEMVLGRNQLLRYLEEHKKALVGLEPILQNVDRLTTEMQEKVMQTRMQPVAYIFNKFPRISRELAKGVGKEVNLVLKGAEVELDKSIIEALTDPLTHLLRNALDHGIEAPSLREQVDKPRAGQVVIWAYHDAGQVHIDVTDDGGGIDIKSVKEKGLERKLITETEALDMGESEILQLIFKPGFSTVKQVSDLSGRGVGMDVVKTNVERLGGSAEVITKLGQGTTMRLRLPLTVAIISSLIVTIQGQQFAIPQANLQEVVRVKDDDLTKKITYVKDAPVLLLRGMLLPLIDLTTVFKFNRQLDLAAQQMQETTIRVVVLKSRSKRYGLLVDSIQDGEEILVKPLPKHIKDCGAYSGVTILGDGKTALILDPESLSHRAKLKFPEEEQVSREKESAIAVEVQSLLLFKCAGPETYALDMASIARVQEIKPDQLEPIGNREYIQFRGGTLQVIRPERYLPVKGGNDSPSRLYVIIPKGVVKPIGILSTGLVDSLEHQVGLDQQNFTTKGLLGSAIIRDKIVLLLNLTELIELADLEEHHISPELACLSGGGI